MAPSFRGPCFASKVRSALHHAPFWKGLRARVVVVLVRLISIVDERCVGAGPRLRKAVIASIPAFRCCSRHAR